MPESSKEKLIDVVKSVLVEKFRVPEELLTEKNYDAPFTGEIFRFDGIMLTYLFLEIEKTFDIQIDADCLTDYKFNTVNGIADVLQKNSMPNGLE